MADSMTADYPAIASVARQSIEFIVNCKQIAAVAARSRNGGALLRQHPFRERPGAGRSLGMVEFK